MSLLSGSFDRHHHVNPYSRLNSQYLTLRESLEELVLQLAWDNGSWRYRRIAGALGNLGHQVSHQTVANILQRQGIEPAPERGKRVSWRDFIRSHLEVLAAIDFFTAEVWTADYV